MGMQNPIKIDDSWTFAMLKQFLDRTNVNMVVYVIVDSQHKDAPDEAP